MVDFPRVKLLRLLHFSFAGADERRVRKINLDKTLKL